MKKIIALLVAVLLLFSLAACGGKVDSSDPNQGLWKAKSGEMMGLSMEVEDFFGEGFTIELQSNGKCALNVDGSKANGTWTLENGAFTVKGGGLDCSGRLENGFLTLENVLDMGLTLIFEKEGSAGGSATSAPSDSGAVDAAELSDIQRQWNGTWFGFMMFNSGTGAYEDGAGDADMYMVVDVDAGGNGSFTVYSAYNMSEWGKGSCVAREGVLEVIEGELMSSPEPMVPADWTFYQAQDSDDKIVNTSDFTDNNGDTFNYSLFFKPWGADWQDEVDSGRPTYPPGYEDYIAKVNAGEPSPFDVGSSGDKPDASGGTTSGGELSGPLGSWSQNGVTVSFPSDTYEIQQDIIGNDFIARKDGSVQITLTVDTLQSDVKANEGYHDSYSDNEDYTTENITIGGFSARRTTYSDDWATQLYNSMVSMDFGASDSPAGITIQIGSDESIAATWTPEIQAILNTIVRD